MLTVHDESVPLTKQYQDISSLKRKGETIDGILGGCLKVIQKEKGYRFSIDAYLLAHFVRLKKNERVLDMGTGSGIISMIVAHRWSCGKVIGIDIEEEMVDMAQRSVVLNNLCNRVEIRQGNIRAIETLFDPQSLDVVIFNPPYRKLKTGRTNPDYQKSVARHEIKGSLSDFLAASGYVLKMSGRAYIIYPASRMVELMFRMRDSCVEPKRMQMVHSQDRSRGEFVLVEGVKGGKEELEILPPLSIYTGNGVYSEAMTRLFREISECH
jgi:tRNA1Val (adenine37-N6)-methyltransferase